MVLETFDQLLLLLLILSLT